MLFTFAGSSHSKYTTYLLEFLVNFELESSCALQGTTLNAMLVNLSGKAGSFSAGDIIQEFFNRLLEAILERKGADFGANFIRQVISRNLHHMGRVKTDLREGVGLAVRAGRHSEPHTKPEVTTLLKLYARHELHSRRPGRTIDEEDIDDFQKGWEKLAKGKLKRWVAETTRSRRINHTDGSGNEICEVESGEESDGDTDDDTDDEDGNSRPRPTFGSMHVVDGGLVVETGDFEETVHDYLSMIEAAAADASDGGESTESNLGNSETNEE